MMKIFRKMFANYGMSNWETTASLLTTLRREYAPFFLVMSKQEKFRYFFRLRLKIIQ